MSGDSEMTTKYNIKIIEKPFFVGNDLWIQAYKRQSSEYND